MKLMEWERDRATVELSMAEVGLVLNALSQELGHAERHPPGELDPNPEMAAALREEYESLYHSMANVIEHMDAAGPTRS
jgi:hypothetical protein